MNLSTRFSFFCERVMEAGWLMAAIAVPLFFNIYSSRVFEPDKLTLLRSIALVVAAAWVAKQVETGFATLRGPGRFFERLTRDNPLTVPVLLVVATYVISTVFSVAQYVSVWGSYQRLQGTYSMLSYITIFAVMLHALTDRAQLERLFTVIVLTSLPIAAYGWLQHFRLDPLPWGGDVSDRIASNMGNSIFVGAYLIMAMPITLGRWLNVVAQVLRDPPAPDTPDAKPFDDTPYLALAGAYTFILAFQLLAIAWTQSRGAWIGGFAGTYVFVLIGLTLLRQWVPDRTRLSAREVVVAMASGIVFPVAVLVMAIYGSLARITMAAVFQRTLRWMWLSWIVTGITGIAMLAAMNVPGTPLSGIKSIPGIGRLGQILDTEQGTNKVRFLIWEGASQLVLPHGPIGFDQYTDQFNAIRPLIGYGPEAMYVAYNSFYPPDLGHLEARNASPDRSHNETWDSLVTTGLFGFLIYITLFGSMFFNALRWLGFASKPRDRNLFVALWVSGALVAALITYFLDRPHLRLLGVAMPVGMLGGLLVYLGIQVLFVRQHEGISLSTADKILVMALLSATIGFFAEIHFGIAIASTRTYFWTYFALLILIGYRMQRTQPAAAHAAVAARTENGKPDQRLATFSDLSFGSRVGQLMSSTAAGSISVPVTFARRRERRSPARRDGEVGTRSPLPTQRSIRRDADSIVRVSGAPARPARRAMTSGTIAVLIHGLLLGIILQIMVFNYINRNLTQSNNFQWILALLAFTLAVGALVMTAQIKATVERAPNALVAYVGVLAIALVIAGVYIVLHLNRLDQRPANVVESIGFVADVITWFYLYFFALLLALAVALLLDRPLPPRLFNEPFYLVVYGVLAVLVVFGIVTTNLNSIRADIFYKQGLNFDGQRQFDGSLCMYEEAIRLAQDQDFYYLFYGRAFLEKAKSIPEATQAQPLYNCYPNNPALAFKDPPGVARTSSQRVRLMETARYFLVRARDLNPLNTDHTANLARMYRTWAEITPDAAQRTDYLTKAVAFYGQAQLLSPHNAQILNEYGSAIAMLGQTDRALAKLEESLAIDKEYAQTYLLLGDLYTNKNEFDDAVKSYQQALELDPGLLQAHSALGMLYSRQGKVDLAIQENLTIISQQPNDYNSLRNLALLYRDAGRIPEAIVYAQRALAVAPEQDKAPLQQLIAQLQASLGASGAQPLPTPTPTPTPSR